MLRLSLALAILLLITGALLVLWRALREPAGHRRRPAGETFALPEPQRQPVEPQESPPAGEASAMAPMTGSVGRPVPSEVVAPASVASATALRNKRRRAAAIAAVMAYLEEEALVFKPRPQPSRQANRWKMEGRRLLMASRQPSQPRKWHQYAGPRHQIDNDNGHQ